MNGINQRTQVQTTGSAFPSQPADWNWGYDALGQVISADPPTASFDRAYEYGLIGNRKRSSDGALVTTGAATVYDANNLNQYSEIQNQQSSIVNPVHDPDGNATSYPLPVAPTTNATLAYDGENRLISVTTGATTVSYAYDSQSRRVARTEGSNVTLYLYDRWNCMAEYSTSDLQTFDLKTAYTWGLDLSGSLQGAGGVGGLLATTNLPLPAGQGQGAGVAYYATYDGNGNISEYLTASGSIAAHFEYDPFGRTIVDSGSNAGEFQYLFSTKPDDASTGLYYYGYRWFDPEIGRWINRDPIEERGGMNLYDVVGNAGVGQWDYLGREWESNLDYFYRTHTGPVTQAQLNQFPSHVHDTLIRRYGFEGDESGSSQGLLDDLRALIPFTLGADVSVSTPSLGILIGPVNAVTSAGAFGKVVCCENEDGSSGLMFEGGVFLIVDVGVGTLPLGAFRTGVFNSGPRQGERYFKNAENGRFTKKPTRQNGVGTSLEALPRCEETADASGKLLAYISGSYVIGSTRLNGEIGECSLSGGCDWTLESSITSQWGLTPPGLRAGIELAGEESGTILPLE